MEAEYVFEELEKYNFDIFDQSFHKNNAWSVPLRMSKANNSNKYFDKDFSEYQTSSAEFDEDTYNKS